MGKSITIPEKKPIRQVMYPCEKCGSYYRRGDNCNMCGLHAPVPRESETMYSRAGHAAKGRRWDSKQHKYVG